MPAPKTFSCVIEKTQPNRVKSEEITMSKENPYYGHFTVEKEGCIEGVLAEMNAPPGLARGCGVRIKEVVAAGNISAHESDVQGTARKINMGSIMDMWRDAMSSSKDDTSQKASGTKGGPPGRTWLNADRPLGKS